MTRSQAFALERVFFVFRVLVVVVGLDLIRFCLLFVNIIALPVVGEQWCGAFFLACSPISSAPFLSYEGNISLFLHNNVCSNPF